MTKGLERRYQAEIARTFYAFGNVFSQRLQQDATICLYCKKTLHPRNVGYPDVFAELAAVPYPIPVKIEGKANVDRILLRAVSRDQRKFLNHYTSHGGIAFIWMMIGDGPVNSKANGRCVWLIPYSEYITALIVMLKTYSLKYIPLRLQKKMRLRDASMTIEFLFSNYKMEWVAEHRIWKPCRNHPLWQLKGLIENYDTFGTGSTNNDGQKRENNQDES